MNDKGFTGIIVTFLGVIVTAIIAMNGWMIHMQINKADKLEAQDRWTGALMNEYKEGREGREKLEREIEIAYKASITKELKEINSKLDTLMGESGIQVRGSERE